MKTIIRNPNWWRKRTTLKRYRSLKSVFAGLALFSLVSGLAADICNTAECLHTASAVLGKINTEIKPCDDFYQFACGTYIKETQIPAGKVAVTTLLETSDKVQKQLEIVVKERRPETDPKPLRLPNALYKACINTNLIETLGAKPIHKIAKRLGGWPVMDCDCWDTDNFWTWPETVKKFRRLGFNINYMMGFSIGVNSNNSNKRIINEPRVMSYYDYMVDMAVLFGAHKETAERELRKSLQFEINLANISLPLGQRRHLAGFYNLRSIKQMQESYPYLHWLDYINALLPEGQTVEEDEIINVSVPSFFEELGKLLEYTDNRDIANYLMWRIHAYSADFLSKEFRERKLKFTTELGKIPDQQPKSIECLKIVLSSLPILVDSLYVRKYFRQDSKAAALEMFSNIRNVSSRMFDETEWMDHKTKQEAKKKLNLMNSEIGYPDELFDDSKLEEYYGKLHIDPDKYFKSSLRKKVFDTDDSFNKLRLPVDTNDWKIYDRPAQVNAFYAIYWNGILLPAGILQGHFFNIHRPKYMNYGAIGSVIGHEITHGFFHEGSELDGNGDPLAWWQNTTRQAYKEKAQCVIKQYGSYTIKQSGHKLDWCKESVLQLIDMWQEKECLYNPRNKFYHNKHARYAALNDMADKLKIFNSSIGPNEVKVDGKTTLVENIADSGGIKASYLAYSQWVAQNGEEQKLPGLNYTPKQMFWISSAQRWCAKFKGNLRWYNFGINVPEEFRVLGPFSSTNDFSRDFQCADGAPMSPVTKCNVW